jgi:catechol 2,3-dioxygenase-like lactoylglutathione lyase family enzyme
LAIIKKALDPKGHLKICSSDFEKSRKFYLSLFEKIGYKLIADKENSTAWASEGGFGFWLAPADKPGYKYEFGAPGFHHFCFKAESKKQVDELHKFLVAQKVNIFDAPKAYPEYTAEYYAVFFADPDGLKLEFAYY